MIAHLVTTNAHYFIDREVAHTSETTRPVLEQLVDQLENKSETAFFDGELFDGVQTSHSAPFELPTGSQWEGTTRWLGAIKKRFDELCLKEALGEADATELEEFHFLLQKRRKLQNPRSALDIERDIKNQRAMRKVLEGLSEYVRAI